LRYCQPSALLELQNTITNCVDDVSMWMRSNRLQLNTAKTEILWSTTGQRSHQLPQSPLRVGIDEVIPTSVVRDLGIYIDYDVSMRSHVTRTVSACFAVLRQLRSIRRSVPRSVFQSLVASLVLTRLDYGNSILAGIPQYQLKRLQSVMNAAAWLVFSSSRYEPITPLLRQLHWLKAAERIDYKLALFVYKCRLGVAPPYLADELSQPARASLRSTTSSSLFVRRTRLSTIGDWAFPVAAARVWNCLPQHVTSAPSLSTFRSHLKTLQPLLSSCQAREVISSLRLFLLLLLITAVNLEHIPLITTLCSLSANQFSIQFITEPVIPCALNFCNNLRWATLSNAF